MKKQGYERRNREPQSDGVLAPGQSLDDGMEALAEAELSRVRACKAELAQMEKEGWTTSYRAGGDPSSMSGEMTSEPVEAFTMDPDFDYDNVQLEHSKTMGVKFSHK